MKVTIDLPTIGVAKMPVDGGLVLPDNLEIEFTSSYAIPELVVFARNGEKSEKAKITDARYTVPDSLMVAGVIEIEVAMIARGELVKRWAVEPLAIREVNGEFTAFAAFREMQEQIQELLRRTEIIQ